MPVGRNCLAHGEHLRPVPIDMHSVRPVARGGRGTATVPLCANAHGLVHALLDEIERRAVASPYATVHEVIRSLPRSLWAGFDGRVRLIAYAGWAGHRERGLTGYGSGFLSGRYATHFRLWWSDGSPKLPDVPVFADVAHAARWSSRWRRELERL